MSKDTISVNMNVYDIPILVEQLEKANKEIKILKEEYVMLQNASDEVEEEKDKEIERLNKALLDIKEYCNHKLEMLEIKKRGIMEILAPQNGYLKVDIEIEMQKYKDILDIANKGLGSDKE